MLAQLAMPKPDTDIKPNPGEIIVTAAQLRKGVHVRLPVKWSEHQFLFNSFVIETDEQVREIASMQLPQLFCEVARCKVPPLPESSARVTTPERGAEAERREARKVAQIEVKLERSRGMTEIRTHLERTHKLYSGATTTAGGAIRSFDADPKKALGDINEVSQKSTSLLLQEGDNGIVLIAERGLNDTATAHALSVMTLSLLLGKQARLPEDALRLLGSAALLHDIGKDLLNPSIVKNTQRNRQEEAVYQTHCALGLERVQQLGRVPPPVSEAILHHHERCDGSGYPDHQQRDQIHIAARIIGLADRFSNLVNPLNTRDALSPSEALSRIWAKEARQFDPLLLQVFIKAMGVYPPGTIVQLTDGRIAAVVVSAGSSNPLCPKVLVYEPEVPRSQALIIDLATETSVKIDRALRVQDRSEDELDYLLPRRDMSWFPAAEA